MSCVLRDYTNAFNVARASSVREQNALCIKRLHQSDTLWEAGFFFFGFFLILSIKNMRNLLIVQTCHFDL